MIITWILLIFTRFIGTHGISGQEIFFPNFEKFYCHNYKILAETINLSELYHIPLHCLSFYCLIQFLRVPNSFVGFIFKQILRFLLFKLQGWNGLIYSACRDLSSYAKSIVISWSHINCSTIFFNMFMDHNIHNSSTIIFCILLPNHLLHWILYNLMIFYFLKSKKYWQVL